MGLLTAAQAHKAEGIMKGPKCSVFIALHTLDKVMADELVTLLAMDPWDMGHTTIARALHEEAGIKLSPSVLSRHRTGRCSCVA